MCVCVYVRTREYACVNVECDSVCRVMGGGWGGGLEAKIVSHPAVRHMIKATRMSAKRMKRGAIAIGLKPSQDKTDSWL